MALNVSIDVGSSQSYMKFDEHLKVGKQLGQMIINIELENKCIVC